MDKIEKKNAAVIQHDDVVNKIKEETDNGSRIVLPLAVVIECGNHVAQIKGRDRAPYVQSFAEMIENAIDGIAPWDVFSVQSTLMSPEALKELVNEWKRLGVSGLSMGDTSIKKVAEFYASKGFDAEIYTGDDGLKAYQPFSIPVKLPRNRNRR